MLAREILLMIARALSLYDSLLAHQETKCITIKVSLLDPLTAPISLRSRCLLSNDDPEGLKVL
jgi:hypothetical protein